MRADAGAHVVIAHPHQTQRLAHVVGQLRDIDLGRNFGSRDKLLGNRQGAGYDLIDFRLDSGCSAVGSSGNS